MSEASRADGIAERLSELEQLGRNRRLRMVSGPQGPRVLLDGRPVLLLCSNNYLGLADHPRVRAAAAEGAMRWGVGAGASRLVSGTMTIHRRLEERLAAFERRQGCVLFGSGYLANLGVIGALAGRGDTVFSDELNHASIVDGCRLAQAEVVVYRHGDMEHLDWLLRRHGGRRAGRTGRRGAAEADAKPGDGGGLLIVTDSLFSMDGDSAPLEEIIELARLHGARVAVDEAHAIGACGPGGRGLLARAGLEAEVDVIIGTLGKALASYGAFACADGEMIRYLINTARSLIFSTAPPPAAVAGSLAALELLEERPHRVQRLCSNARVLRRALAAEGFPVLDAETHIVALIVGEERAAMQLCQEALERGVFAQAIRPPAVPAGTARLRLAAMSSHTVPELRMAAGTLADAARAIGLDPARFGPSLAECEPTFAEPTFAEPRFAEPTFAEPAFAEPAFAEPTFAEPDDEPTFAEPAFAEPAFAEPAFAEPAFAEPDDEIPSSAAPELPPSVFDHERLAEPDEEVPASPAPEPRRPVFDYERDASTVRAA